MGLTYEEARRVGLGHLHPDAAGGPDRPRAAAAIGAPPPSPGRPADGYRSKLERSFAARLEAARRVDLIFAWWFEPVTLRLAGRTRYTPDFLVDVGDLVVVEVKGAFAREDAMVKLKVAAALYPCFDFVLVRRSGRHGWEVRPVTRDGIGTRPVRLTWLPDDDRAAPSPAPGRAGEGRRHPRHHRHGRTAD